MTFDINEYWGVTASHAALIGPSHWQSTAWVFRRDNFEKIGSPHIGAGSSMNLANDQALLEAKQLILTLGMPNNWEKC
jgi:hypothetical protein